MVFMGHKFRAPKRTDVREWSRIEPAIREGRDYGVPTVRKPEPKPKISPRLRIALGISGKRKPSKYKSRSTYGEEVIVMMIFFFGG